MKTIGLIGGMSWESTATYYETINREVGRRLGGLHSAKIVSTSVDFHEVEALQRAGAWDEAGERLAGEARRLEDAGADFVVLCTNTMHRVAERIEREISIPLLHIADATAERVRAAGFTRVGLLGTRFTMEQDFYRGRLEGRHGLRVLVPSEALRDEVNRVIYEELCRGEIRDASRRAYLQAVAELRRAGARGVILGCTEIGLMLRPSDVDLPLFDTARIHAQEAADLAMSPEAK